MPSSLARVRKPFSAGLEGQELTRRLRSFRRCTLAHIPRWFPPQEANDPKEGGSAWKGSTATRTRLDRRGHPERETSHNHISDSFHPDLVEEGIACVREERFPQKDITRTRACLVHHNDHRS